MQIIDTRINVACPEGAFARAFERYENTADHHLPAAGGIDMKVHHDGHEYVLASGRRELSAEIAADETWHEVERQLQVNLRPWLQVPGLCIDGGSRRLLVIGEDKPVLRSLAIHALANRLCVSSAAGICIRNAIAVPYALPFDVTPRELALFRAATGCPVEGLQWRDMMGTANTYFTPVHFGQQWSITPHPVDSILLLEWNPGGWSGAGPPRHPSAALERIVEAAYLPPDLEPHLKLMQLAEARALASAAPLRSLHLGRHEDFAPLVREQFETMPARG